MVDIAPNHIGLPTSAGNYTNFTPFNDVSYFHDECSIVWNNKKSEQTCWLEGLPDLRTEDSGIRATYSAWIKDLVANYSIDGLRIDTALEIEPEFWTDGGFKEAAGVFLLAEINHTGPDVLAPYQQYVDGYMDYSSWTWYTEAFQSTTADFATLFEGTNVVASMTNIDPSLFGSFVENHDQVRFPYRNGDVSLAKNIIAMSMLRYVFPFLLPNIYRPQTHKIDIVVLTECCPFSDGIPISYYATEQHYAGGATPNNREALWLGAGYDISSELYGWTQQTNKIRVHAAAANADFLPTERTQALFYDNATDTSSSVIAFRKGQLVTMFTNGGTGAANNVSYAMGSAVHGYAAGDQLVDVENCENFTVAADGRLNVQMPHLGLPRVFLPVAQTDGLCINVAEPVSDAAVVVSVDKNMGADKRSVPFVKRRMLRGE